jgi:hypothetical protein
MREALWPITLLDYEIPENSSAATKSKRFKSRIYEAGVWIRGYVISFHVHGGGRVRTGHGLHD